MCVFGLFNGVECDEASLLARNRLNFERRVTHSSAARGNRSDQKWTFQCHCIASQFLGLTEHARWFTNAGQRERNFFEQAPVGESTRDLILELCVHSCLRVENPKHSILGEGGAKVTIARLTVIHAFFQYEEMLVIQLVLNLRLMRGKKNMRIGGQLLFFVFFLQAFL